jgi:two-component system, NtrC family, sensor kinase
MKTKSDTPSASQEDACFEAAIKLLEDPGAILANIMASMGDGLSIQDRNMRIVYQNRFMIDNFGPHVGDYCYNIYEKRSLACEGCPIIESYRTGQVTKALRLGITKDGFPFRFENIASVLRNKNGEIVAGIELCRIVEEREKAFDELRETMERLKITQNQLVRAEKLAGIGQLAAGVAHEINNPTAFALSNLSVIRKYIAKLFCYVESMERLVANAEQGDLAVPKIQEDIRRIIDDEDYRYLKEDLPEVIEESLDGLQRIKSIVSSLLSFAASSRGELCPVDINGEIESALLLLDSEIGNKNGRVAKNLGALPKTLANPQQLQQMFVNLLLNASQAIEPNGVITIGTQVKNNHISIEISDSGVGISADIIQNIFNPFFTTHEVGKGVGLGLSVAYRIIEGHNGNIDVQSEPGCGTTFTIRLPIVSEDSVASQ